MIDRFLAEYVDVDAGLLTAEADVLLLAYTAPPADLPLREWESVPLANLSDVLDLGLGSPRRAFTMYLQAKQPW